MLLVLLALAAAPAAPAPSPATAAAAAKATSAAEVVSKVTKANAALTSWSCRFLERRLFVHFNETETKQGKIQIKRGLGLRVDIEGDEETIVVSRTRAVQWRPKTKQLHVYQLDPEVGGKRDLSPIPFAFGDSGWSPQRDHEIRILDNDGPEIALELKPTAENSTYVRKVLWIDPRNWLPVRLQLTEATDDTITFVFSEIELNPKLDDHLFELKPPPGADVVEHKDLPSF